MALILVDVYEDHQVALEKEQVIETYEEAEEAEAAQEDLDATSKVIARAREASMEFVLIESRVKRGETLEKFLLRNKVAKEDRQSIIKSIRKYFSPRLIMPGHRFYFRKAKEGQNSDQAHLTKVIFILSSDKKLLMERDTDGTFHCSKPPISLKQRLEYHHGTVEDSLYAAGMRAGLKPAPINQLIRLYSYSIDFQRALRSEDTFEVLVEKPFDQETGYEGNGEVVYATLFLKGGPLRIYRHTVSDGSIEYFNEKGEGTRKALLKTPVKGARISSKYGKRKHPIRGYTRMHRGVDFAAPRGTPIFAAGDGVIKKLGRLRGFGNYIFIQHNKDYGTAYAHLHRYGKNMQRGKNVKQGDIIGYVGMTGLATAPHLHYEIHYRGKQVNPQLVNMAPQKILSGKPLEKFLGRVKATEQQVEELKQRSTAKG